MPIPNYILHKPLQGQITDKVFIATLKSTDNRAGPRILHLARKYIRSRERLEADNTRYVALACNVDRKITSGELQPGVSIK
jgi:hypothetical protein